MDGQFAPPGRHPSSVLHVFGDLVQSLKKMCTANDLRPGLLYAQAIHKPWLRCIFDDVWDIELGDRQNLLKMGLHHLSVALTEIHATTQQDQAPSFEEI